MNKSTVFLGVGEVSLLFGAWRYKQEDFKGRDIVIVNRKTNRAVGAIRLIDLPVPLNEICPVCGGKGEVELKIIKGGEKK